MRTNPPRTDPQLRKPRETATARPDPAVEPGNIFVVRDPEAPAGERVKILDFGLAKIAKSSAADAGSAPHHTTTGMIMGTPLYMSPEQCRGLAYADDKTDVYSLGILLFEMLAGQPPFVAETAGDLIAMQASAAGSVGDAPKFRSPEGFWTGL